MVSDKDRTTLVENNPQDQVSVVSQLKLENTPANFVAGKISKNLEKWKELTSDKSIIDIVRGYVLEFDHHPIQHFIPSPIQFNDTEWDIVNNEVIGLLDKQVIKEVPQCQEYYFSNIFIRPKKDGSHRLILNLKGLNKQLDKKHFTYHLSLIKLCKQVLGKPTVSLQNLAELIGKMVAAQPGVPLAPLFL